MIIYIHTLNFKVYHGLQELIKSKCKIFLQCNTMIIQADFVLYIGPYEKPRNLFCEITLICGNQISNAKAMEDSFEMAIDSAVKGLLKNIGEQGKFLSNGVDTIKLLYLN